MIVMQSTGRWTGRIVAAMICVVWLGALAVPDPVWAKDDDLSGVFMDGLFGGLIGAVVGTAAMALTSHPDDHLRYIATGAAIGVIAGTVYGLSMVASRSMAEIDHGRVVWSVPSLQLTAPAAHGQVGPATYSASLLRIRFE